MTDVPFSEPPEAPARFDGAGVLLRLVQGLAFRSRWASEGLPDELGGFSHGAGAMTIAGLMTHIEQLVRWVTDTVGAHEAGVDTARALEEQRAARRRGDLHTPAAARARTLAALVELSALIARLDDRRLATLRIGAGPDALPVWNLVNGPLADALTHVGQLSSWRRLAGSPAPKADVFRGRPPRPA